MSHHEGFHRPSVSAILDYRDQRLTASDLYRFLERRQTLLRTQVDVATFLHWIPAEIQQLWPDAFFLLVVRHPCRWACSYLGMLHSVGQHLHGTADATDMGWVERYGRHQAPSLNPCHLDQTFASADATQQLIRELIDFWSERHRSVCATIRRNRLMVTSLDDLASNLPRLACRAGLSRQHLQPLQQLNTNPTDPRLQQWLHEQADRARGQCSSIGGALDLYEQLTAS